MRNKLTVSGATPRKWASAGLGKIVGSFPDVIARKVPKKRCVQPVCGSVMLTPLPLVHTDRVLVCAQTDTDNTPRIISAQNAEVSLFFIFSPKFFHQIEWKIPGQILSYASQVYLFGQAFFAERICRFQKLF